MKGIIALDIDGTITDDRHTISRDVVDYLESLSCDGWRLIFITGRTFKWGYEVLQYLNCPYYMAVQNGAIILEMPQRNIKAKKYLNKSIFPAMEAACKGEPSDFAVYTGYEHKDICYYRPDRFNAEMREYLARREVALKETFIPVNSFDEMDITEFPSVKAWGWLESANRIAKRIENSIGLHVPVIHDPFQHDHYVAQATHAHVSKGYAVKDFKKIVGNPRIIIAAGDDNNDRSMLEEAHIKVVMSTAPKDMLATADIIAPPASQNGIIKGLKDAIAIATLNQEI